MWITRMPAETQSMLTAVTGNDQMRTKSAFLLKNKYVGVPEFAGLACDTLTYHTGVPSSF